MDAEKVTLDKAVEWAQKEADLTQETIYVIERKYLGISVSSHPTKDDKVLFEVKPQKAAL